jgi:hypothetical protein
MASMKSTKRTGAAPIRDPQVLTALRLAPTLLKRADRLRPLLAAKLGAASRTTVLRLALLRGLDALEAEYK